MQYGFIQGGLSDYITLSNVMGVLGFLALIASAVLILKSRALVEALAASDRLVKSYKDTMEQYDREKKDLQARLTKTEGELKEVTEERDTLKTAYTTAAGIVFKDVADFYFAVIKDLRYVNNIIGDRTRLQDEVRLLTAGDGSDSSLAERRK